MKSSLATNTRTYSIRVEMAGGLACGRMPKNGLSPPGSLRQSSLGVAWDAREKREEAMTVRTLFSNAQEQRTYA
jgi:hypothetical protein